MANMKPATTLSDYEVNARRIAASIGLEVRAAFKGDRCPTGSTDECDAGNHVHGDRYRVTLIRLTPRRATLSFDFWNSAHDKEAGTRPGYYDILASVSSDMSSPTTADNVVGEYGPMLPSQAEAIASFARRLRAFFTPTQRDALAEIS